MNRKKNVGQQHAVLDALRQAAAGDPKTSGGAAPLAAGEARRAVTSGDIGAMFKAHAEMA